MPGGRPCTRSATVPSASPDAPAEGSRRRRARSRGRGRRSRAGRRGCFMEGRRRVDMVSPVRSVRYGERSPGRMERSGQAGAGPVVLRGIRWEPTSTIRPASVADRVDELGQGVERAGGDLVGGDADRRQRRGGDGGQDGVVDPDDADVARHAGRRARRAGAARPWRPGRCGRGRRSRRSR